MAKNDLTQERLKSLLSYDPDTGIFRWINSPTNCVKAGQVAGTPNLNGYVRIIIDKKKYYAHRLAWLYVEGKWPKDQIDHINGNRSDNRIANLREVNQKQNSENVLSRTNNTSGERGVVWLKEKKKWRVQIRHNYKSLYFGNYKNFDEAVLVAKKERERLFTHSKE